MAVRSFLAALCVVFCAHLAFAQSGPNGGVEGPNGVTGSTPNPLPNWTLTGATKFPGPPTTITINPTSTVNPFIGLTSAYDYSVGGENWYEFKTILAPSVNTTQVWQNLHSWLVLDGAGSANGELNAISSYIQAESNSGSSIENYEARLDNTAAITSVSQHLVDFNNQAGGTATTVFGIKFQPSNTVATAGVITTYSAIDLEALAGGGSQPTNYLFLRNADSNAQSVIEGGLTIGSLSPQGVGLAVLAPDSSGSTNAMYVKNSSAQTLFQVIDNGSVKIPTGTLTLTNGILTSAAPTVAASQIGIGSTTSASSSCGSIAGAAGCMVINVAGTTRNVPFF